MRTWFFPLFPENQNSIQKFSAVKKLLRKNVTLQIKPKKLTNKKYQIWALNFVCFHVLFIAVKTGSKLTLQHMGGGGGGGGWGLLFNFKIPR